MSTPLPSWRPGATRDAILAFLDDLDPILAIGNSGGDRELLEWAQASRHGGLAVLIDHDDDQREFAYQSTAATFEDNEPITTVGERLGWVIASMRDDWQTIFTTTSLPT